MKNVSPDLAAHLAGEVTTFARCWLLTRADGTVFGFTDHDRDILLDGMLCLAATGLNAAGLTEQDLASGRYDGASVTSWLVNWVDPAQRLQTSAAVVGEVKRTDVAFVAELRSLAHRFDEERGRLYTQNCLADLGDARCGYPVLPVQAAIDATDGRLSFISNALGGFDDGWFTGGRLIFVGGQNDGFATEVKLHRKGQGEAEITLWQLPAYDMAVGDVFAVQPGCDKRFATCRDRFANHVRFRGFPHMPGNDVIMRGARNGEAGMDGGSLFR
jgi:uncharacterized phage protein (TIGR02218 family)